jgi:hypothetical protein
VRGEVEWLSDVLIYDPGEVGKDGTERKGKEEKWDVIGIFVERGERCKVRNVCDGSGRYESSVCDEIRGRNGVGGELGISF